MDIEPDRAACSWPDGCGPCRRHRITARCRQTRGPRSGQWQGAGGDRRAVATLARSCRDHTLDDARSIAIEPDVELPLCVRARLRSFARRDRRQYRRPLHVEVDCKPSSVPCGKGVYDLGLPPPCPRGGGHPSSPSVATGIKRPTRRQAGRLCLPIRSCTGWGLPCSRCLHRDGELLPRHFNLAPTNRGGIFSVALSVGSPRPAVSRHPARGCSDFPPSRVEYDAGRRPPVHLTSK